MSIVAYYLMVIVMKEKNEPVLFVNSVSVYRSPDKIENHVKLHRLDDIKVLLNLSQEIEVEVECLDKTLVGYIKELHNNEIVINIENKENTINLSKIKGLKILSSK